MRIGYARDEEVLLVTVPKYPEAHGDAHFPTQPCLHLRNRKSRQGVAVDRHDQVADAKPCVRSSAACGYVDHPNPRW
ncbi:MAG: hypothetical protein RL385_3337 [Pseudomonadota bacterium]|jgi:hypothetical protein